MISRKGLGKKITGAALSMAVAASAIPAMSSLACGFDEPEQSKFPVVSTLMVYGYGHDYSGRHSYGFPGRDMMWMNPGFDYHFAHDSHHHHDHHDHHHHDHHDFYNFDFNHHHHHHDDDQTPEEEFVAPDYGMDLDAQDQIAQETDDTSSTDTYGRAQALDNLYNLIVEMNDFVSVFGDEIPGDYGETLTGWADFGASVYAEPEGFTEEDINGLIDTLDYFYNVVIDATDEAMQSSEFVAPDYGMDLDGQNDDFVIEHQDDFSITPDFQIDPQDSFTLGGETEEDEFVAPDYGMDLDAQDEIASEDETEAEPEYPSQMIIPDRCPTLDETESEPEYPSQMIIPDRCPTLDETESEPEYPSQMIIPDRCPTDEAQIEPETQAEVVIEAETEAQPEIVEEPETESDDTAVVVIVINAQPEAAPAPAVEPAPAATAPAAAPAASSAPAATSAAPVAQVLGAARDRNSMVEQLVERLYVETLNRNSDLAGKTSWVNMILNQSGSVNTVINGFLNSAEFNARNLSDEEFITILYRVMFNRTASAAEKESWLKALANGTSRQQVINGFLNSDEFEATCDAYGI